MSLITQCPACATMFRVVPDQLRISEGWVRCGHCDEVFDANAHLRTLGDTPYTSPVDQPPVGAAEPEPIAVPLPVPAPEPLPEPPAPPAELQAPAVPLAAANTKPVYEPEPYDWGPVLTPARSGALPEILLDVGAPVLQVAEPLAPQIDPFLEDNPHAPVPEFGPEPQLLADAAPLDDWVQQHAQEITALHQSEAQDQRPDAPFPDDIAPTFLATDAAPGWALRGPGRAILWTLGVLLSLLLGLQWLLSDRDHLYATAPALRPVLSAACGVVGCEIAPPRQIDAIAIDSSTFSSVKPGVYLLKVTLKNAAAIDLATPALELTLTDSEDQPLLRRIVMPAEFNGERPIAAGAELAAKLPVGVKPGAVQAKIAGYKLLAFYP